MLELWFYSGRLGNCMFQYAFNRCIADTLDMNLQIPKGTEITGFPRIAKDSIGVNSHKDTYEIAGYIKNKKNKLSNNDNMLWFIENQFNNKPILNYYDNIIIANILNHYDIDQKYIVTAGNFEIGHQYLPYRNKILQWFTFPSVDLSLFEFFRIDSNFGLDNKFYQRCECPTITSNDLLISLRLEDYIHTNNLDRLLTFDYFKIILSSRDWNNIFILTNPSSIGHNVEYNYIKQFYEHNPILIRCYDPVQSLAFGSQYNNIAISQSTYSWWLAFLSIAETIYYPISKSGPFSLNDKKYLCTDLRVPSSKFIYVDYETQTILPKTYYQQIDYINKSWIS